MEAIFLKKADFQQSAVISLLICDVNACHPKRFGQQIINFPAKTEKS